MNARKTGRLITALAGMAAVSMTAAFAGTDQAPAKAAPTKAAASSPSVIVKLGEAMLEEYHGGDPARRTTILRGGDVAQKTKAAAKAKTQS